MKKNTIELRIGVIVAIVSAIIVGWLGLQGWVLNTLYNQNGEINKQGSAINDTEMTTHQILNILVSKSNSAISMADDTPLR